MICSDCRSRLKEDDRYCPYCGAHITTQKTQEGYSSPSSNRSYETAGEDRYSQSFSNYSGYRQPVPTSYNALCFISVFLGFFGVFIPLFGLVGIVTIILSIIALRQAKRRNQQGRILAIVGIVLGLVSIVIGLIHIYAAALIFVPFFIFQGAQ